MQQYELLYIIPVRLEENEQKEVISRVDKLIADNKGVIKDHSNWLTRKLSYPIKHIRQGVFMLAHFSLPGENLNKIRRELDIDEDILRHNLVKTVERKAGRPVQISQVSAEPKILPQEVVAQKVAPQVPAVAVAETTEKVSLEELDKKLEELLNSDKEAE